MKKIILPSLAAALLSMLASCGNSAELNKVNEALQLAADSARVADSINILRAEEEKTKAEAEAKSKLNPAEFNFDGVWVCDIMTVEIKGDSGLFDVGTGRHWFKAEFDKSTSPVGFDLLINNGRKKDKSYAFRSVLKIIDNNTMRIAFNKDLTAKPQASSLQDAENSTLLKRK